MSTGLNTVSLHFDPCVAAGLNLYGDGALEHEQVLEFACAAIVVVSATFQTLRSSTQRRAVANSLTWRSINEMLWRDGLRGLST